MKKSLVLAVLGLAVGVVSSYGQGSVLFSSYIANGNVGATTTMFGTGTLVDSTFKAQLYYSFGTVADAVDNGTAAGIAGTTPGAGLTLLDGVVATYATGAATAGYFDFGNVVIPGYTSGAITFEIVAYNGTDYASSLGVGLYRGRSGAFTMNGIATGANPSDSMTGMPNFFVAQVPEPTTIALAGLGLASLALIRRRK